MPRCRFCSTYAGNAFRDTRKYRTHGYPRYSRLCTAARFYLGPMQAWNRARSCRQNMFLLYLADEQIPVLDRDQQRAQLADKLWVVRLRACCSACCCNGLEA